MYNECLCIGFILFCVCFSITFKKRIMPTPENIAAQSSNNGTPDNQGKPANIEANMQTGAPETGKTSDAPDSGDIKDIIVLLNLFDKEVGGTGEIADVPAPLLGSIKFLVGKLSTVKDMFEDPLFKAIVDDMVDQAQDGKTPSMEVAVARNIPLSKLQELADSEDYESIQQELAEELDKSKQIGEEDAMYEANFAEFKKGIDAYCSEKKYDDTEKDALTKFILGIMKVFGDGKLTKNEVAQFDKMRNYDKDVEALNSQIGTAPEAKEVLPDMSSVEPVQRQSPSAYSAPKNQPGMGSMEAYMNPVTDVTAIKGQNRRNVRN